MPPQLTYGQLHELMSNVHHLSTTVDVFAFDLDGMSPAQTKELVRAAARLAQGIHQLSMQRQHWAASPSTLALIDEALQEGGAMMARISSS